MSNQNEINNAKREMLEKSLENMNCWLQFAETKHAALIAFVIAALAFVFGGDCIENNVLEIILAIIYFIGLVVSLWSFSPRNPDVSMPNGTYDAKDNLLYWADIAKYSDQDYLKRAYEDLLGIRNVTSFKTYEKLYAEEIVTNARIASRKYKLFRWAMKFVIAGTILIPIFLILVA